MPETSDIFLFNKVKNGDTVAFEEIFRRYYNDLARYCFTLVRDETIAEEITQEVYIYLWEKKDNIEISSSLKSYLFSAIRNKSINYIKYELPKQRILIDISDTVLVEGTVFHEKNDIKRLKKKIQVSINQLPEKCKQIFLLSRYGGMTYKEIAEDLDLSVKTVENQMSIALKKLRDLLESDLKNYLNE
ncbi:MAG: RNA polymerase sigma-70 factor [Cyclobacteriaceae bacterium]|tara:strand:+ start:290 stop:853 length:564 start_codon:yes stop_codon:yes gene_type:complete